MKSVYNGYIPGSCMAGDWLAASYIQKILSISEIPILQSRKDRIKMSLLHLNFNSN